jgi:hypothetical protein
MLLGLYQKKIGAICWEKEQRWLQSTARFIAAVS